MTQQDMHGNVCLVTGSSSGLGKATALQLAQLGATVILGCRDRQRGEAALAEIKAASGQEAIELLLIDLSVQQSVREMAATFKQRHPRLDVLINNAAVFKQRRTRTVDGVEMMFATNHLGPFLLTNLLLEQLQASPSARMLTITAPSRPRWISMTCTGKSTSMPCMRLGHPKPVICSSPLNWPADWQEPA